MAYDTICAFLDFDTDLTAVDDALVALGAPETVVHLVAGVPAAGGHAPEAHARLRASAEARLREHADGLGWLDEAPELVFEVVNGGAAAAIAYATRKGCELMVLDGRPEWPECPLSLLLAR